MSNQPEPAPMKPEPSQGYSRIGLVVGICAILIDICAFTPHRDLFYLVFFGSFVGFVGVVVSLMGLTEPVQILSPRSRKMAMTGLVASVAGIVPCIVLICYSVSEGHKSRESSACLSNAKQIGLAMRLYADDNDGRIPPTSNWHPLLRSYVKTKYVFYCPTVKDGKYSYGMNTHVGSLVEPEYGTPTNTVFAFDCSLPMLSAYGGPEAVDFRHRMKWRPGFANIIFIDGHAKTASEKKSDLPDVITIDQVQWKP